MSITPKYFCDGPEGHFYCDDLEMARKLVNMIELYEDDWTITELPLKGVTEIAYIDELPFKAYPDCGCCKGDGSMCKSECRHAQESPTIGHT